MTKTILNASIFNLASLADLPDELRKPLESEGRDNAVAYAELVKGAAEAGIPSVNIREVCAFAHRAYGSVPTLATVRNYLNSAVKLGLIGKPTRASYSADTSVVVEGDEDEEEAQTDAATAPEADPLAGF